MSEHEPETIKGKIYTRKYPRLTISLSENEADGLHFLCNKFQVAPKEMLRRLIVEAAEREKLRE